MHATNVPTAARRRALAIALAPVLALGAVSAGAQERVPRPLPPPSDSLRVPISLERLMSPDERRSTGVGALDPAQRRALEEWLERYTAAVAHTARELSGGGRTPSMQAIPPSAMPRPRAMPYSPRALQSAAWACYLPAGAPLAEVSGGGAQVVLADGTQWEIELNDQPRADGWQPGDFIIIERTGISSSEDFRYQLLNTASRWRATARFVGVDGGARGARRR